jgi:hypothetical protein
MNACLASNVTADGIVYTGACKFYGCILYASTADADASVIIYDGIDAGGTIIMHLGSAVESGTGNGLLPFRVGCLTGLFVDITGANASCTVYYKPTKL